MTSGARVDFKIITPKSMGDDKKKKRYTAEQLRDLEGAIAAKTSELFAERVVRGDGRGVHVNSGARGRDQQRPATMARRARTDVEYSAGREGHIRGFARYLRRKSATRPAGFALFFRPQSGTSRSTRQLSNLWPSGE